MRSHAGPAPRAAVVASGNDRPKPKHRLPAGRLFVCHAAGMRSPQHAAGHAVEVALDKALDLSRPAVLAHLRRLRRSRPQASPADLLRVLERHYLATVTAGGVLAGGAAAVPVVGPGAALALNLAQVPAFFQATALLALSYAEVHGIPVDELERRRTLVFGTLLGNSGSAKVMQMAGRSGKHWGKALAGAVNPRSLQALNKVLGRNVVTKWGTTQGVLVLGRELPLGFGAGIGAAGNAGFGYLSVRSIRRAFGPPPAAFPTDVERSQAPAAPEPDSIGLEDGSDRAGNLAEAP